MREFRLLVWYCRTNEAAWFGSDGETRQNCRQRSLTVTPERSHEHSLAAPLELWVKREGERCKLLGTDIFRRRERLLRKTARKKSLRTNFCSAEICDELVYRILIVHTWTLRWHIILRESNGSYLDEAKSYQNGQKKGRPANQWYAACANQKVFFLYWLIVKVME